MFGNIFKSISSLSLFRLKIIVISLLYCRKILENVPEQDLNLRLVVSFILNINDYFQHE